MSGEKEKTPRKHQKYNYYCYGIFALVGQHFVHKFTREQNPCFTLHQCFRTQIFCLLFYLLHSFRYSYWYVQ